MRIQVVEGVNAGRDTLSNDGHYELANLEPGTLTLLFTTAEYRDLQRTEQVRADTTLNVQLERRGLTLSGRITTQWGEPIDDAGVEARSDGGARGSGTSYLGGGMYRIPTLPPADYVVRVIKWGCVTPQRTVTMTGDTTLDFVLDRVRVSVFGKVSEAPNPSRQRVAEPRARGRLTGTAVDGANVERGSCLSGRALAGPANNNGETNGNIGKEGGADEKA